MHSSVSFFHTTYQAILLLEESEIHGFKFLYFSSFRRCFGEQLGQLAVPASVGGAHHQEGGVAEPDAGPQAALPGVLLRLVRARLADISWVAREHEEEVVEEEEAPPKTGS